MAVPIGAAGGGGGGAVRHQAAPAEAVRAGQHNRIVQQAQADGALVLRLQFICRRPRVHTLLNDTSKPF